MRQISPWVGEREPELYAQNANLSLTHFLNVAHLVFPPSVVLSSIKNIILVILP